jgi:superfamily II DNA helicase RecQ
MARSGHVNLTDEVFEKDGKQIPYRSVQLTASAYEATRHGVNGNAFAALSMKQLEESAPSGKARGKSTSKKAKAARQPQPPAESSTSPGDERLATTLRAWRVSEAKRLGVPAFRIFGDRVLREIVEERPVTDSEFLAISGIGAATVKKYGTEIYRMVQAGGGDHSLSKT